MKPRTFRTATAALLVATGTGLAASCSVTASSGSSAPGTASAPGRAATGTLANGTTWVAQYPESWNGTLVLYSHGYGALTATDAPDAQTQAALLARGYALAGSSYDPHGSGWALNTAVGDQFGALAAVETTVLPRAPQHVIAFGTSMGGLVSALEAQQGTGKIDGAVTTCGVVAGGVNLDQYQLDGEYAIAQLLGVPKTRLTGLDDDSADTAASALNTPARPPPAPRPGRAGRALAGAFLNVPAWAPGDYQAAPANAPAAEEEAQYKALTDSSGNVIDFMEGGRVSIEQADGGQAAWTAGTNFASALAGSPYLPEVRALYQTAGLNLRADLATLTAHAGIRANPAALRTLRATSVPTGRLAVPELDLHTIGDNLVPVQNENFYAQLVSRAGRGSLLRQAYTQSQGHCNFSVSEQVASVQAVLQRVTTGQWGSTAAPASLERAATALQLGPAHFAAYSPGRLTGACAAG